MSKKPSAAADAWDDDDWEAQADQLAKAESSSQGQSAESPAPPKPLTKKERWAKHNEEQRKLWESAEAPKEPTYLPLANEVPLATPFQPVVKLLSRKPAPRMIAKRDPVTGIEQLTLQDDDEDDDANVKKETPEEINERLQLRFEKKKEAYDKAREQILGKSNPSSGQSTPGATTPPQVDNNYNNDGRGGYRGGGRGRGRGGGRGGRGGNRRPHQPPQLQQQLQQQPQQQPQQHPQQPTQQPQLFDPTYSPKPRANNHRRGGDASPQIASRSHTPREEDQVIRLPRGPDASGRGGFGFARRGGT